MSSTFNTTGTHTHNIVYVTDQMMSALRQLIILAELNPDNFMGSWVSLERAMKAWFTSRHLQCITLEIYDPANPEVAVQRWDFEVDYDSSIYLADLGRWSNKDVFIHAIKKYGLKTKDFNYRVVLSNKEGRPDVQGWSPTTYKAVSGLTTMNFGTTIGSADLNINSKVWC